MTAADHANTVREALDFKPHWHTQAEKKAAALPALDALEAQAEDAEKRAQRYKLDFLRARERAEAAEAERDRWQEIAGTKDLVEMTRVAWLEHDLGDAEADNTRLREALREIADTSRARRKDTRLGFEIARAALAGEDT